MSEFDIIVGYVPNQNGAQLCDEQLKQVGRRGRVVRKWKHVPGTGGWLGTRAPLEDRGLSLITASLIDGSASFVIELLVVAWPSK